MKNISFLFGAGISQIAGMPGTSDITRQVLSAEGIARYSGGNYYFGKPQFEHLGYKDIYITHIIPFLNFLKDEIKVNLNFTDDDVNYEVLFYHLFQINSFLDGDTDDAIVSFYVKSIIEKVSPFLDKLQGSFDKKFSLEEIVRESVIYINNTVKILLRNLPDSYDHLDIIKDAILEKDINIINIFSLNHDTIIENFLRENSISFTDGFGEIISGKVRIFDRNLFLDSNIEKVRFIKLHGSINWYRYREDGRRWEGEFYGEMIKGDIHRPMDVNGISVSIPTHPPIILIGTNNKLTGYTEGFYIDLFFQFFSLLSETNTLIISGYSFGDKGVNSRIISWLYDDYENRRFIIIHPDTESLKNNSRGAVYFKWDLWIKDKKLLLIEDKFENVNFEILKKIEKGEYN